MWLLPPMPPRFRTAGGRCREATGRQSHAAFPGGLFLLGVKKPQILEAEMKSLSSGEKVPASGIYRVLHSTPHTTAQREMYFEGSRFPECPTCAAGLLFRLESPCIFKPVPIPGELKLAPC